MAYVFSRLELLFSSGKVFFLDEEENLRSNWAPDDAYTSADHDRLPDRKFVTSLVGEDKEWGNLIFGIMEEWIESNPPFVWIRSTIGEHTLTAAGLTVAVYEEVAPANTGTGTFKKLKQRALAQVCACV